MAGRSVADRDGVFELKDVLRAVEVLQPMLAQVHEQRHAARQRSVWASTAARGRQQHLAAVTGGHQARRAVHRWTVVIAGAAIGRPGVDGHAHAQRHAIGPRLTAQVELARRGWPPPHPGPYRTRPSNRRRWSSRPRRRSLDRATHDRVVANQGVPHCLWMLLPQSGAAFKVGEHEGDRVGRIHDSRTLASGGGCG